MQLKDIIKYFDILQDVKLYIYYFKNRKIESENNASFEGLVYDIPWPYLNYYLYNNDNEEAISTYFNKNMNKSILCINLIEPEVLK